MTKSFYETYDPEYRVSFDDTYLSTNRQLHLGMFRAMVERFEEQLGMQPTHAKFHHKYLLHFRHWLKNKELNEQKEYDETGVYATVAGIDLYPDGMISKNHFVLMANKSVWKTFAINF